MNLHKERPEGGGKLIEVLFADGRLELDNGEILIVLVEATGHKDFVAQYRVPDVGHQLETLWDEGVGQGSHAQFAMAMGFCTVEEDGSGGGGGLGMEASRVTPGFK